MSHINIPAYPSLTAPSECGAWGARLIDKFVMSALPALISNQGIKTSPRAVDGTYTESVTDEDQWRGIVYVAYQIAYAAMRMRPAFLVETPLEETVLFPEEIAHLKALGYKTIEDALRDFDTPSTRKRLRDTSYGVSCNDSGIDLETLDATLAGWAPFL